MRQYRLVSITMLIVIMANLLVCFSAFVYAWGDAIEELGDICVDNMFEVDLNVCEESSKALNEKAGSSSEDEDKCDDSTYDAVDYNSFSKTDSIELIGAVVVFDEEIIDDLNGFKVEAYA